MVAIGNRKRVLGIAAATCLLGNILKTDAFVSKSNSRLAYQKIDPLQVYTAPEAAPEEKEGNALLKKLSEKIGKVDDSRIVFPEYESGEVSRMFSALEYSKSEQGGIRAEHSPGSVVGAAALIAGTMIGTGILALPAATAPAGFLPSTAAMVVGWFYMTMSGLLISELSINRMVQSGKPGRGMLDLYESLGPIGSKIGSAAYLFLHYAVMVAYIAQGGSNVEGFIGSLSLDLGDTQGLGPIAFASTCALWLYAASPAQVEKFNSALVLVLAAAFAGIVGIGSSSADFSSLIDLSNQHPEQVPNAFPIIFLSLAFQNVVPSIVNQLEGDRTKITQAIIAGTTLPLLLLITWNAIVLGNVQGSDLAGLDPVALLQSIDPENAVLGGLVGTFSSVAVLTTLTGFVYGLLDALTDAFSLPREGQDFEKWKLPLFGLIFAPPLAFSLYDPDVFFKALDFGGAFGVSTLFLVLPPVMVWSERYSDESKPLMTKPMGKFSR
jgi:tyrosine-specific transport protein